jgi:hypothetical protein
MRKNPTTLAKNGPRQHGRSLTGANRHVEWNEGVRARNPVQAAVFDLFDVVGRGLRGPPEDGHCGRPPAPLDEGIDHVSAVPQEEREYCHQR